MIQVVRITLLVLMLFLAGALMRSLLEINYITWVSLHRIFAPLILTEGFVHSFFMGTDLKHPAMRIIRPVLFGTTLASLAYARFARPAWLKGKVDAGKQ